MSATATIVSCRKQAVSLGHATAVAAFDRVPSPHAVIPDRWMPVWRRAYGRSMTRLAYRAADKRIANLVALPATVPTTPTAPISSTRVISPKTTTPAAEMRTYTVRIDVSAMSPVEFEAYWNAKLSDDCSPALGVTGLVTEDCWLVTARRPSRAREIAEKALRGHKATVLIVSVATDEKKGTEKS